MVQALELADELKRDGISRAELARRHGMSRARVTQWLSLLDLPRLEIEKVLAMGDYWERRLVTERGLRNNSSVASRPAMKQHEDWLDEDWLAGKESYEHRLVRETRELPG